MSTGPVVAACDKFKGTADAVAVCAAIVRAVHNAGLDGVAVPLSDGGDGLLDVFGGANRVSTVTGPLGDHVDAPWRLDADRAVVESARASGLVLAGGADHNDPMRATSAGTGELIEAALTKGARTVLVGLGGVASTDGGLAAVDALSPKSLEALATGRAELVVCCDVTTVYEDAARVFGPQKGATRAQIDELTARLRAGRATLRDRFGVDVGELPGSGAAGGLAGGLAAVGGRLQPGFDTVAGEVGLADTISAASLVITGEGRLDHTSFDGKVVGGVVALARDAGVPVIAVVGDIAEDMGAPLSVVSLVERFGSARAMHDTLECIERAVLPLLER